MNPYSPAEAGTLVSVIVPVFKISEVLLVRCLRSVLSQTHGELEVLVVDDGSPFPIDEWVAGVAQGDPRVVVLRQANQGVSAARNAGMEAAVGSYVCFVDADDYVAPQFVADALVVATRLRVDAVFGGIEVRHPDGSALWRSLGGDNSGSLLYAERDALDLVRAEALAASPSSWLPTAAACVTNVVGGLFSRSLTDEVRFRVGVTQGEDRLFIVDALEDAQRVAFCVEPWYIYDCTQAASATRSMPRSAAAGLGRTVQAFADVGGYTAGDERQEVPAPIRRAAATGVFNYLKVIAGLLGALVPRREAVLQLSAILQYEGVPEALAALEPKSPQEALYLWCARRGSASALLLLGRIWAKLLSPSGSGRARAGAFRRGPG